MSGKNFKSYVSQKSWKDSDKTVQCTVECTINEVAHKAIIESTDPMEAINFSQKNFSIINWQIVK